MHWHNMVKSQLSPHVFISNVSFFLSWCQQMFIFSYSDFFHFFLSFLSRLFSFPDPKLNYGTYVTSLHITVKYKKRFIFMTFKRYCNGCITLFGTSFQVFVLCKKLIWIKFLCDLKLRYISNVSLFQSFFYHIGYMNHKLSHANFFKMYSTRYFHYH